MAESRKGGTGNESGSRKPLDFRKSTEYQLKPTETIKRDLSSYFEQKPDRKTQSNNTTPVPSPMASPAPERKLTKSNSELLGSGFLKTTSLTPGSNLLRTSSSLSTASSKTKKKIKDEEKNLLKNIAHLLEVAKLTENKNQLENNPSLQAKINEIKSRMTTNKKIINNPSQAKSDIKNARASLVEDQAMLTNIDPDTQLLNYSKRVEEEIKSTVQATKKNSKKLLTTAFDGDIDASLLAAIKKSIFKCSEDNLDADPNTMLPESITQEKLIKIFSIPKFTGAINEYLCNAGVFARMYSDNNQAWQDFYKNHILKHEQIRKEVAFLIEEYENKSNLSLKLVNIKKHLQKISNSTNIADISLTKDTRSAFQASVDEKATKKAGNTPSKQLQLLQDAQVKTAAEIKALNEKIDLLKVSIKPIEAIRTGLQETLGKDRVKTIAALEANLDIQKTKASELNADQLAKEAKNQSLDKEIQDTNEKIEIVKKEETLFKEAIQKAQKEGKLEDKLEDKKNLEEVTATITELYKILKASYDIKSTLDQAMSAQAIVIEELDADIAKGNAVLKTIKTVESTTIESKDLEKANGELQNAIAKINAEIKIQQEANAKVKAKNQEQNKQINALKSKIQNSREQKNSTLNSIYGELVEEFRNYLIISFSQKSALADLCENLKQNMQKLELKKLPESPELEKSIQDLEEKTSALKLAIKDLEQGISECDGSTEAAKDQLTTFINCLLSQLNNEKGKKRTLFFKSETSGYAQLITELEAITVELEGKATHKLSKEEMEVTLTKRI